ncbi:DUF4870 domain-containing protein [Angustibacter sp. Root456]|uniref:DUF4870 domain-containing protein n=1 Tax=Angustibacter sp. Root456 TaxID=1736539 RepID=UPI0006FDBD09|nr:DUF4870 domain-containing protein [Angustibacter sp. Root456]KQX68879.1 hypothetical protein ASD06_17505 [Angustibacter sp. Root456]
MTQQPDPNASREGEPDAGATPPPAPPTYGQPPTPPPPAPGAPGGYPGQPAYGQPTAAAPMSDSDERMWAMLAHLGGIVLGFLAPLVVWLVFRERSAYVDDQGKEALNFQIAILIGYVVGGVLSVILIGFLVLLAVWVISIVFAIMAGIAANRGERYRYPVTLRLIK